MVPCIKTWLDRLLHAVPHLPWVHARKSHAPIMRALAGEAWISIGNNRLRTLLAMLGIVIGIGSVVIMLAIGTGSQRRVERTISTLGTNLLIINVGYKTIKGGVQRIDFSTQDVDAIAEIPSTEAVGYSSMPSTRTVFSNSLLADTRIIGTIPAYLPMRNWTFEDGSVFNADDLRQGNRVVVIGKSLVEQLFPDQNPLGRTISVGDAKIRFQIVGILQPKGPGLNGDDQDNIVFMPITTFKTYFGNAYQSVVQIIYAKAASADVLDELKDDIRKVLRQRHNIPESRDDSFTIQDVTAIMQVASETTRAFSMLLAAIASISLLVGGIGIMNIMLVTVSERTREIGIRKAIGATEQQIMIQFLLEAVMIAGVGSVAGLLVGFGGGRVAEELFSVPAEFSLWSVVLALGMAIGIGLPSGIYPAYKAAKLEPIEALRAVGG